MTEEELFKVYIKRELCVHCGFPQCCKDCYDIATAKRHYLAGVEAGKSLAETDLAMNKQLIKAKELLTRFVMASVYFNGKETDLIKEAEHFLREVEK